MSNYDLILEDLIRVEPQKVFPLQLIYKDEDTAAIKIKSLQRQIRRAKSMNARKDTLVYMWHMGNLIENNVDSTLERSMCMKSLSSHYRSVVVRTYYLFEVLGVEQIMRTKYITPTVIAKLKITDYRKLLQEVIAVAGARLLEEEVVNGDEVSDLITEGSA